MSNNATPRKTVLITGCSPGGIGYILAKEFHSKGLHVIATARRLEVLQDLKSLGMSTLALDVADSKSIEACKQQVVEITGGRLDILVNNAGQRYPMPATDVELDEIRRIFETNVFGIMMMVKAFVPLLIAARGQIAMISSLSSLTPYVYRSIYASTKGALNSYSRTLRQELKPFGVKVVVVLAGTVRNETTPFHIDLPENSLYSRVKDSFIKLLRFSQQGPSMDTAVFSQNLVSELLKGEGWLGGLIGGTKNWFWLGGMSTQIWLGRLLFGEWLVDRLAYRKFGLDNLEAIVRREGIKQD